MRAIVFLIILLFSTNSFALISLQSKDRGCSFSSSLSGNIGLTITFENDSNKVARITDIILLNFDGIEMHKESLNSESFGLYDAMYVHPFQSHTFTFAKKNFLWNKVVTVKINCSTVSKSFYNKKAEEWRKGNKTQKKSSRVKDFLKKLLGIN